MTSFEIQRFQFDAAGASVLLDGDTRHTNWPVVYVLNDANRVYVGESLNVAARMRQHLENPTKKSLQLMRVVLGERFNKSVCLDLESYLIGMFAGDGSFTVLNRNDGITNAEYYDRKKYTESFTEVFEVLKEEGLFRRSIPEIINSDLFKLSPFKALNSDQAIAIEEILEGLFEDIKSEHSSTVTIQGDPGTGKTIIGIYLMKLLRDIQESRDVSDITSDSIFSDFFYGEYAESLAGFRIALVVPQQSLRASISEVFKKTPGLDATMVLTPFEVGESGQDFDLLIVDETHRLNHRANQPSGVQNKRFRDINAKLYGADDITKTQLDWIRDKSIHQVFLVDAAQTVRPADLPGSTLRTLIAETDSRHRHYRLASQMRIKNAGDDYVGYVRAVLSNNPPPRQSFEGYDLRFFDSFAELQRQILEREKEGGLARLVAGYAWPWISKKNPDAKDITIEGVGMPWNRTAKDWINSKTSVDEVGSIHTVQGYDLNYAGVIFGADLRFDTETGRLLIDRDNYFDTKGKENNPTLGITYNDDDLLAYITNIYAVLMTRALSGTYVYVCDPRLREYLRGYFSN